MIRGTTPTIKLTYKNASGQTVDLSSYSVLVTMQDDSNTQLNIKNDRITFNQDGSFQFDLTQAESLAFDGSKIFIQLRAKDTNNKVIASDVVLTSLVDVLNGEIL